MKPKMKQKMNQLSKIVSKKEKKRKEKKRKEKKRKGAKCNKKEYSRE